MSQTTCELFEAGSVTSTALANGAVTAAKLATGAGGKILQVVNAVISTSTSTGSSTFQDTSVLASITPSATGSKVLVMLGVHASVVTSNAYMSINLLRDTTSIFTVNEMLFAAPTANIDQYRTVVGYTYLDSPSTTSSTTYKVQVKSHFASGTVEINRGGKSTVTLMEVAA